MHVFGGISWRVSSSFSREVQEEEEEEECSWEELLAGLVVNEFNIELC